MSSQLTNLVPIFDGTNYQQWTAAMQSFLMSQGQWKCVKDGADVPTEVKVEGSVTNTADITSYLEDAEKAIENIHLRLHHTIGYQFNSEENPAALWQMLKKKYGVPGISVRATLPSALNVMNASSVGKLVQLFTASRLILYHEGRIDPMKDECHYQIKH